MRRVEAGKPARRRVMLRDGIMTVLSSKALSIRK
jgi:hypothetical protein